MSEIETRADEMREQVIAFHKEHPDVWELFVQFTMEKIEQGYNNYSVNAIFERKSLETYPLIFSQSMSLSSVKPCWATEEINR